MDYQDKAILAPMVRIGTLPIRLLSLHYGADIVYTEELIDYKLLQCKRRENPILQTVDFVWTDGSIIFRTCEQEKGRLILQMGTSDAKRALKVAKLVEKDVSGIDVNMGCPKEFSVKGGMGAALLKQPDKAREILTTLVQALSVPVTCKIRILDTLEETLTFVKLMESTGIAAIGIHGRKKDERPRHENHNDIIKKIAESVNIPVIANGGSNEIINYEDIRKFQKATGSAAVMVARQAQWNPSVFRKEGPLPKPDVILDYLKYAVDFDSHEMNVKYCMQHLYRDDLDSPRGRALLSAANVREICGLWGMDAYYDDVMEKHKRREKEMSDMTGQTSVFKKRKLEDGSEIVEMSFKFNRKEYPSNTGPKMILYQWSRKNDLLKPQYITSENKEDRTFCSVVHVNGKKYGSTWWEKSKKCSESAAAAVCLLSMGMADGRRGSSSQDDATHKVRQGVDEHHISNLEHSPSTGKSRRDEFGNGEPLNHNNATISAETEKVTKGQIKCNSDNGKQSSHKVPDADSDADSSAFEITKNCKR